MKNVPTQRLIIGYLEQDPTSSLDPSKLSKGIIANFKSGAYREVLIFDGMIQRCVTKENEPRILHSLFLEPVTF